MNLQPSAPQPGPTTPLTMPAAALPVGYRLHRGDNSQVSQVGPVAEAIADSFHLLDSCQWLVPDPQRRATIMPAYLHLLTEHALQFGYVHYLTHEPTQTPGVHDEPAVPDPIREPITGTPEIVAASVWLRAPYPSIADYQEQVARICGPWTARFEQLEAAMDAVHPAAQQHAYLAYLGVVPAHQGRGLGGFLLARHLRQVDEAGQPAYLEASNARSAELYARHGFDFTGSPVRLPECEPIFPMWRPVQLPAPALADLAETDPPASAGTLS